MLIELTSYGCHQQQYDTPVWRGQVANLPPVFSPARDRREVSCEAVAGEAVRGGYVANNSVWMKRCSVNRGVSTAEAAESPPILNWYWSHLQNENKYNEGSEPASAVKGALQCPTQSAALCVVTFTLLFGNLSWVSYLSKIQVSTSSLPWHALNKTHLSHLNNILSPYPREFKEFNYKLNHSNSFNSA